MPNSNDDFSHKSNSKSDTSTPVDRPSFLGKYQAPIIVPLNGLDPSNILLKKQGLEVPGNWFDRPPRVLIPEKELQKRIKELSFELATRHHQGGELVITPVLTGAFMFAADLGRALARISNIDVRFDFAKTSTYGNSTKTKGKIRKVKIDLQPSDVQGRTMLLVDDILDHGFTLSTLRDQMADWKVNSVQVCVLLDKKIENPNAQIAYQRQKASPDLVGFQIPDVWVAGYGLDAAGKLRNLPCIVSIEENLEL